VACFESGREVDGRNHSGRKGRTSIIMGLGWVKRNSEFHEDKLSIDENEEHRAATILEELRSI
jgi:hypothetical protein